MSDTLIQVEGLYKKFSQNLKRSMLYGTGDTLRSMVGIRNKQDQLRKSEFWALQDINFELQRGETLGLIGQNGCGKTTLLRLLTGIFPPDKGKITINGRIGALIAVGAGFHPHMSGRENVFLNGTILGMTKDEIKSKYDRIIDFAEIGDFIDAPVAAYSSGMKVRLGFSIAVHCEPDILLVDEILAVGDLNFQLKCHTYLSKYRRERGATIMVSHNNQLILNTCNYAALMNKGKIEMIDEAQKVVDYYENALIESSSTNDTSNIIKNSNKLEIRKVVLLDKDEKETNTFQINSSLKFRLFYATSETLTNPIIGISIHDLSGAIITANYSNWDKYFTNELKDEGYIDYKINNLAIKKGNYHFKITISENDITNVLIWVEKIIDFKVIGDSPFKGIANFEHSWLIN